MKLRLICTFIITVLIFGCCQTGFAREYNKATKSYELETVPGIIKAEWTKEYGMCEAPISYALYCVKCGRRASVVFEGNSLCKDCVWQNKYGEVIVKGEL